MSFAPGLNRPPDPSRPLIHSKYATHCNYSSSEAEQSVIGGGEYRTWGVRQPHRRSGLVTLPSVGAIP